MPQLFPLCRRIGLFASAGLCLLLPACSSSGGGDPTPATGSCRLDAAEFSFEENSDCPSLCLPVNDALCGKKPQQADCSDLPPGAAFDACGVPLSQPISAGQTLTLTRSSNVKEYGGNGPVDLSCLTEGGFPSAPTASNSATVQGVAKIFSHGCQSSDLDIKFYTVKRTGGSDDGEPDELIGTGVVTAEDCSVDGVMEEVDDCDPRYECRFSYPDVPTETEILIVTEGSKWTPIYEYGLFIRDTDVANGIYEKDVRALATDDYGVIAQVAIGRPINPGYGAVAGEVRDCGDVRLLNAMVDINQTRSALTYFTDNEDNPLPDLSAKATSSLGLYSAMNVAPGPMRVAAAGLVDGKLVGLGYYDLRVFPDAVTSYTFRGLRPHQSP